MEEVAAKKYRIIGSPNWWDRWLRAVQTTSKFLGLDTPSKSDAKLDTEGVHFTIEFDTPDAPRTKDASLDVFELEDPSLM